ARQDKAVTRVLPAHQRLGADDPLGLDVDFRLVEDLQLAAALDAVQVVVEAQAVDHGVAHAVLEDDAALAVDFASVLHGGDGIAQQVAGVLAARGADRRANAELEAQRAGWRLEGLASRFGHALAQDAGLGRPANALGQDREITVADARHGVALAQRMVQRAAEVAEHQVADVRANVARGFLEVVDRDIDTAHDAVDARRALDGAVEPVDEEQPVGQRGDRVVEAVEAAPAQPASVV